jgi:hypothetical protein
MPDLKRFELVLETFAGKRRQLDNVVEAAKLWKFPIANTRYELVWDGEVGMSSWSMQISGGNGGSVLRPFSGPLGAYQRRGPPLWYESVGEFEVRVVRFTRQIVI